MSYHGIDVSEFQGTINWKKVADNGIDFAMVRCGFDGYQDPYWKQNVNSAKTNGLNVGAYWFMYFTNENEAIDNANQFINELRKFDGMIDYPVALDVEEDTYRYMRQMKVQPTKSLITKLVKTFCKKVEQAGYYVMVYTNLNGLNNYLNDISEFDIWLAQTEVNKPARNCGIWQYSFNGIINGINGRVDLDISYLNYPRILKENNLNHLDNTPIQEKPKETVKQNIKVGDKVIVTNPIIYGTNKRFTLWYKDYNIMEISGNRVVIGKGNIVTAPIDIKYLRKV